MLINQILGLGERTSTNEKYLKKKKPCLSQSYQNAINHNINSKTASITTLAHGGESTFTEWWVGQDRNQERNPKITGNKWKRNHRTHKTLLRINFVTLST